MFKRRQVIAEEVCMVISFNAVGSFKWTVPVNKSISGAKVNEHLNIYKLF